MRIYFENNTCSPIIMFLPKQHLITIKWICCIYKVLRNFTDEISTKSILTPKERCGFIICYWFLLCIFVCFWESLELFRGHILYSTLYKRYYIKMIEILKLNFGGPIGIESLKLSFEKIFCLTITLILHNIKTKLQF